MPAVTPPYLPGQRWLSESEPDLGLGSVRGTGPRTVTVFYGATAETREYALDHAPLRRARFEPGDLLRDREERTLAVTAVELRDGLLWYGGADRTLCETELSDRLVFTDPLRRLLAGERGPAEAFGLRLAALAHQYRRRRSRVRGFLGGRIELLPHQLHIASEVTGRLAPRVLLADEVGLGKTIEACLILHRLLLTGRARRVLILLPDSLVHQWFLELLRRFNLWFHIFDEDRCLALEAAAPGANPFLDDQLVLCALSLLTGASGRARQALEAGWDLVVVDEAHHLGWAPGAPSAAYLLVEALGAAAPGLLLLTATPEQLGMAGHFARLHLLDPERYPDLAAFTAQAEAFREVAALAEQVLEGASPAAAARLAALLPGVPEADWLGALLDRHGTGRVLFRNTRAALKDFPRRVACLAPLDPGPSARAMAAEFAADQDPGAPFRPDFRKDPRIPWLAELLRGTGTDKVLLLCRSRAKAEAVEAALRHHLDVKMAVFHEGLTLVQRDRNAAWFGEERGARLLLCSEIGSEGRNFQFAHDLVLFDLPLDPDLLEQRIGRLDRIGQTRDIRVHVPYVRGGPQEVLARWYHEGLDAFQEHLHSGGELGEAFRGRLLALAGAPFDPEALALLARDARAAREDLEARLERGRDRLLELSSHRPDLAAALVGEIEAQDADLALDTFMLRVFEHYFIDVEELGPRSYQLGSMGVLAEAFPGLPAEGLTVTFDRRRALAREDMTFLTWDHPLVTGALDLLLTSDAGTCALSHWPDASGSGLLLEAVFLVVAAAPPHLHLDRFLPPTPLRVLVDARGEDASRALPRAQLARLARAPGNAALLARPEVRNDLLPSLLHRAEALAEARMAPLVAQARAALRLQLDQELRRLQALLEAGGGVGREEPRLLQAQRDAMDGHLRQARLRLDAVQVVHRGPG